MSSDLTEALCKDFDPDLFLTDPDLTASYARDRTGSYFGLPLAVARPRATQDVAAIMVRCAKLNLRAVPQGGLTGLVGAGVSDVNEPEIVVLLDRMNLVRSVDPVGYAMVVEAGCIPEIAKQAADAEECLLPITFGSQGSARIGGNVSTNAGGFNVLRYGMTRDLVLGLEVVLPDGRIWNALRTLRKDNRGYDLKQLFVGAEGTLGIVTAAALKLFPKPTQVETAWLGFRSVDDVMAFYARARRSCSDLLSAFELILRDGLVLGLAHRTDLTDPLDQLAPRGSANHLWPCRRRQHPPKCRAPPHLSKAERRVLFERAETLIFETVDRFSGSISAEHGIGRSKKRAFLERVDPVTLDLFRRIKGAFDADNRLSPGRIFDL